MATFVVVVHLITCLLLIILVLLQAGKGADAGAITGGFGQTYFGSQGGNILTKTTTVIAVIFMATSLGLTILNHKTASKSVMEGLVDVPQKTQEVVDTTPAPQPVTASPVTTTTPAVNEPVKK